MQDKNRLNNLANLGDSLGVSVPAEINSTPPGEQF
jgi:hypothetical protein